MKITNSELVGLTLALIVMIICTIALTNFYLKDHYHLVSKNQAGILYQDKSAIIRFDLTDKNQIDIVTSMAYFCKDRQITNCMNGADIITGVKK